MPWHRNLLIPIYRYQSLDISLSISIYIDLSVSIYQYQYIDINRYRYMDVYLSILIDQHWSIDINLWISIYPYRSDHIDLWSIDVRSIDVFNIDIIDPSISIYPIDLPRSSVDLPSSLLIWRRLNYQSIDMNLISLSIYRRRTYRLIDQSICWCSNFVVVLLLCAWEQKSRAARGRESGERAIGRWRVSI